MKDKFLSKRMDLNLYLAISMISIEIDEEKYFSLRDISANKEAFLNITGATTYPTIKNHLDIMCEMGILEKIKTTYRIVEELPWSIEADTLELLAVGPKRGAQLYFFLRDLSSESEKSKIEFRNKTFLRRLGYSKSNPAEKKDFVEAVEFLNEVGLAEIEVDENRHFLMQIFGDSLYRPSWDGLKRATSSKTRIKKDVKYGESQ